MGTGLFANFYGIYAYRSIEFLLYNLLRKFTAFTAVRRTEVAKYGSLPYTIYFAVYAVFVLLATLDLNANLRLRVERNVQGTLQHVGE